MAKVVCARPGAAGWELMGLLARATDKQLAGLLEARPDLLAAGNKGRRELAAAIAGPESLKTFYKGADKAARQAMQAVCLVTEPVEPGRVAGLLGCPAGDLAPVLGRLSEAWVLFQGEGRLRLNPGLRDAFPSPAGLGPPLRRALQPLPHKDLANIAKRLGLVTRGAKADLVDELAQALTDGAKVARELGTAPAGTKELARLVANGTRASEAVGQYTLYSSLRSERTPLGWLASRGMLVAAPGNWWAPVMPAEVALALRGGRLFDGAFVAEPPALVGSPARTPSAGAGDPATTALELVADVRKLAEAWATGPAKLLQAGGLGVKELRRAAKVTGRPEAHAARLVELAGWAGLVAPGEGEALPTKSYDRWAGEPPARRWAQLALTWLGSQSWLSVAGSPDRNGKQTPALLDHSAPYAVPDARVRRAAVLALLGSLPEGGPCVVGAAAARLLWQQPGLWEGGPAEPAALVRWVLDEAVLVGLATAGHGDEVALSPLGRAVLGLVESAEAQPWEDVLAEALAPHCPPACTEVVLQADLTAVAAGELPPGLAAELGLLADVESEGHATVYRFSEASLRRGFEQGRTARQVVAFLEKYAAKGVPQVLSYLVEDIGRRFGEVRAGAARSYLRSEDPALLGAVVRTRKLARLGLRALAPTVAVSQTEWAALVQGLREAGYMVAAEASNGGLVALGVPTPRRLPARSGPAAPATSKFPAARGTAGGPGSVAEAVAKLREPPPT
ncbi:MAG: helicase-associated domain-containing protein, partial [Acidimicrobiales bacterium]